MEVSGQFHTPAALPQRKSPRYLLDRRLGGPQSRSGHGGEENNFQSLPGFEPQIIQPVAQRYTTELSRLLFSCNLVFNDELGMIVAYLRQYHSIRLKNMRKNANIPRKCDSQRFVTII
jgi:hypothetical protein